MPDVPIDQLDTFRQDAALSHGELWLRYFELGGMSTGLQLEAYCYGALEPSRHDHDVIAHALNERFVELGGNHPVPYVEDTERASAGDGDGERRRRSGDEDDSGDPAPQPDARVASDSHARRSGPPVRFGDVGLPRPGRAGPFLRRAPRVAVARARRGLRRHRPARRGPAITFQRADDFVAPTWPHPAVQQQLHIDLAVDDMEAAHERALALGARHLDTQEKFPGLRRSGRPPVLSLFRTIGS